MKQKAYLFLFLILCCSFAWGQTRVVTGRVQSDSAEALSGVSVAVKGGTAATSTNAEGQYSITIPDRNNVTLVFSYVGRGSLEASVGTKSVVDVTLRQESSTLNDVVVVGYTSVRRRDLTGSVSSVGAKQLRDIPLSSAAEALTGKLAGVQVTTTEGSPGADVLIRVRGGGSITQDNAPIYIVDGIQVENALSVISPQDIASVDVLKDASTTAIYGARGANGVVIITTKSGRPGKTVVSYNGSAGWRQISKKMDVLNPYDFVLWQYERFRLQGDTAFARQYGSTWDTLANYKNAPFINWQDEVFGRKAVYQNHNVALSGGNQNTTFNLSLTSNKEDGILLESGFDRKLVNFKLDNRASDKFRFGFTTRYLDQIVRGAGTTTSGTRTTNRLRNTIQYRPFEIPTAPGADDFDEDYFNRSTLSNPVLLTSAEYRRGYTKGVNVSGYFTYNILKNLVFRSTAGFDNTNTRNDQFYSKITGLARQNAAMPIASVSQQSSITINNSNTLQYSVKKLREKHDFDVLVGQEIYETRSKFNSVETRYLPTDISAEKALSNLGLGSPPSGAAQPRPVTNETPASRIFSFFGRTNYSYDNKILGSFSLRADRSTKFKYDNGLLVFPSGSLAYRFSQEEFMQSTSSWLSEGKIRVGFGTAGNNRIGDLLYLQLYGVNGEYALNHSIVPGFAPSALANENLRWEKTVSQNIGLDLSFFKNRVQFTVDAYKNTGKDLLLQVAIPPTSGYSSQLQNVGSTSNRGVEFQVNGTVIQKRNFSWSSNFNISFNRNRVESLGGLTQQTRNSGWQGSDGADDYLIRVGQPIGLMYGFVSNGWYTVDDFNYNATTAAYTLKPGVANSQNISGTIRPGSMKIKDINGDGLITNDSDRIVIGNANPDFSGGWNNQFSYKNFDLSVFVNFVAGGDIYNANKIEWTDGTFPNLNLLGIMRERWTNINDQGVLITDPTELTKLNANAKIYSPPTAQRYFLRSDAIEDGSFLRVNNLTLGYTLPASLVSRVKISQFRVYATVNNLAVLTNYSGYDPEVTARRSDPLTPGVDFAAYPRARTWVFGVNVSF